MTSRTNDPVKRLARRMDALERKLSNFGDLLQLAAMTDALLGIAPFASRRIRDLAVKYAETDDPEVEDELQRWTAVTSIIRSIKTLDQRSN